MFDRWVRYWGFDGGGWYVEGYTDDDGGSGHGEHPHVQRWYGRGAPLEPPSEWTPLFEEHA
jgi:hypothetical protein